MAAVPEPSQTRPSPVVGAIAVAIAALLVLAGLVVATRDDPVELTGGPAGATPDPTAGVPATAGPVADEPSAVPSATPSGAPTATPLPLPDATADDPVDPAAPAPTIGPGPTGAPLAGLPTAADAPGGSALPTGTCVTDTSRPEDVASVTPTDCAAEHTGEVYLSVVLTQPADTPYPGLEVLEEGARELCRGQAFETYVGVPFAESRFFTYALVPTEASWAGGDRDVACVLYDVAGPMTGTQQGSGR